MFALMKRNKLNEFISLVDERENKKVEYNWNNLEVNVASLNYHKVWKFHATLK